MKNHLFQIKQVMALAVLALFAGCQPESLETPQTTEFKANASTSSAVTSGTFSALSYNVAGLPAIISSSDPAANTGKIGLLIRNYNIVHVQEDFNYHATLYANDNHPNRTATSGGVPFGDGLNTLSNYPISDFTRIKWNKCNGTDCLTPKGFTFSRIQLASGVYVDFYNAHPNAGTEEADLAARRANITQLSQYITQNSAGNAVIIMGDLNCRYTRAADNIRELSQKNGLTDAWIKLIRNNSLPTAGAAALICPAPPINSADCEVVDRIFYKSSNYITLSASNYAVNDLLFVNAAGEPLSDHYPLSVRINWSLNSSFSMSNLFGGPHGIPFNDLDKVPARTSVTKVALRVGTRVDKVALTLNNGTLLEHGGNGGTEKSLTLNSGEYVQSITLCAGKYNNRTRIFYAEYKTSSNRTLAGGTKTSDTVTYTAPDGWQIAGLYGNASDAIYKLGVIYTKR